MEFCFSFISFRHIFIYTYIYPCVNILIGITYSGSTSGQESPILQKLPLHIVSVGQMWRNDHWASIIFELSKKLGRIGSERRVPSENFRNFPLRQVQTRCKQSGGRPFWKFRTGHPSSSACGKCEISRPRARSREAKLPFSITRKPWRRDWGLLEPRDDK